MDALLTWLGYPVEVVLEYRTDPNLGLVAVICDHNFRQFSVPAYDLRIEA